MADAQKKQLAYNIIEFLRASVSDGTVKEDDKESIDVAVQCLSESFGVDPDSDGDKAQYSLAPASLLSLLDVYLKTRAKTPAPSTSTSTSKPAPTSKQPDASSKAEAEKLKTKGNELMGSKLYDSAIEQYTRAIELDGQNPVYYSNRAAAWGALGMHDKAAKDARKAIEIKPDFAKGWSRLGHALFSEGDYPASVEAYEKALELDPSNNNVKSALAQARTKSDISPPANIDRTDGAEAGSGAGAGGGSMPDLAGLASMMGGLGGGGGGMPDIAAMMRNPQMMAMAQQMMANGGLERLMQNPQLRSMAENMQNGGGMPDFSALANDPSMRDLAQQFMGGQGGR